MDNRGASELKFERLHPAWNVGRYLLLASSRGIAFSKSPSVIDLPRNRHRGHIPINVSPTMAVQKNDGLHRIEFQQWLLRKMKDCIASNVQRAWRTRCIGSIPCSSCGGLLEREFDQLESVLRHVFSTGFGVLPETQCPGSWLRLPRNPEIGVPPAFAGSPGQLPETLCRRKGM